MDIQEMFLQYFEDINWKYDDYANSLIADINSDIHKNFENIIEYFADKKEIFFTDEEKTELYEVIKQKTYLELAEQIKDFILLKK